MKKLMLASLLCATSSVALAESSFDYNYVDISYVRVTIEDEDTDTNLHQHGINLQGSGELDDQFVLKLSGALQGINQDVTLLGEDLNYQQTDLVANLELMKYFVVSDGVDINLAASIGHIQSETTVKFSDSSFSSEHQNTPVALSLGSRVMVGGSGRIEFAPAYTLTYIDEDTSSFIGANLYAEVLNEVELYLGYGVYLDDDAQSVTFGVRFN